MLLAISSRGRNAIGRRCVMQRMGIAFIVATVVLGAMPFQSNSDCALASTVLMGSYFPIAVKNFWVYTATDPTMGESVPDEVVAVVNSQQIDGNEVCLTNNYEFGFSPDPIDFFIDRQGRTCEHKKGKPAIWYPWTDMGLVVLPLFDIDDCMRGSNGIMYHAGEITVPAGTFDDCFRVTYNPGPCWDSGLVSETFAFGVGLVERKVVTFAGTRTWALAYTNVGGNWLGAPSRPVAETTWGGIKAVFAE
jgi:hypothetical protein